MPRPSGPRAVWRDLRGFFSTLDRNVYLAATAAIAVTAFIIYGFWHDSRATVQPQIVYAQIWSANRTDAEIQADNKKRSIAKHAAEAERRREFQQLADQWGIK